MALYATRDFSAAPDVTLDGTVLTGTAPWQSRAYPGPDDPGPEPNGIYTTRNVWHALRVPAAGTMVVHDVPGDGEDTVMSAYQAPTHTAFLGDCTFLDWNDDAAGDTKASLTLALTGPCWIYIEHGFYRDTGTGGGPDDPGPVEQMAWQFTAAGLEGVLHPGPAADVGGVQYRARLAMAPAPAAEVVAARAVALGANALALIPGQVAEVVGVAAQLGGLRAARAVLIQNPLVRAPALTRTPNLGLNAPVALSLQLHGSISAALPELEDPEDLQARTMPGTVLSLPTPAIVAGRPTLPAYWAASESGATAVQGPAHIHAIADPDPVWNPVTAGWRAPPPDSGVGDARWSVQTLPDPPAGGYYWLGEPSSLDGTRGIGTGARHWAPDRSTPGAPSWHSFFPFKPSVRAADSYLPGGNVVHHPKGVHLNSRFIEHMWCDFGSDRRQPFSFVIAAMIASFPSPGYTHYLLDAGRDPDSVGFPRISDSATGTPRNIADGLGYRQLISASPSMLAMATDPHGIGTTVLTRIDASRRPKMYYAIFNGSRSTAGVRDPGAHHRHTGAVSAPAAQHHRYFVLGRRQNRIAQGDACHLIVFEIRYWHRVLSTAELDEQYGQLSSTYKFNQYRAL